MTDEALYALATLMPASAAELESVRSLPPAVEAQPPQLDPSVGIERPAALRRFFEALALSLAVQGRV